MIGWGFETNVYGSGLKDGMVTPVGKSAHKLTTEDVPFTLDIGPEDMTFVTLTMLEKVHPDSASYAYAIYCVMGDALNFSVSMNLPAFPIGSPAITNPDQLESDVPLDAVLKWECPACTGDLINASPEGLVDDDSEIDQNNAVGAGGFDPGMLEPGTFYIFAALLLMEIFSTSTLERGANGIADLNLVRSVSNTNTFSTAPVPLPAALPLLLSSLLGLGFLGRGGAPGLMPSQGKIIKTISNTRP